MGDIRDDAGPLDLNADRLREECGVFGIFGHPDAAAITALGLHALQHRGQEAAGIVSFDGKRFHSERRMGLVGDNFSRREVIDRLPGTTAIGHVRYSTTGETILRNVQPLFAELEGGGFAIGHNGNLTNGLALRRHAGARRRHDAVDHRHRGDPASGGARAAQPLRRPLHRGPAPARGRLRLRRHDQQEAGRRPRPARHPPAGAGQLDGCPILASETCALDIIGAKYVRDVENGEVLVFDDEGAHTHKPFPPMAPRPCIFEYIYFSRPGLDRRRPLGLRRAQGDGRRACARGAGLGRRDRAGAGFRRAGRDRLFAGLRHSLRARHHPQPLRRPHLHRADPADPPARRAAQAQRQPRRGRTASASCWSTIRSCAARPRPRSCR